MFKNVIQSILGAARRLFGNWRMLLVFFLLYAALLATIYWFIATREGNVSQLLLTLILALLAPVLFFIIQTMAVSYPSSDARTSKWVRLSLRDFWKLALMTVPIILLAWLIIYLLGKLEPEAPAAARDAVRAALPASRSAARASAQPIQWREVTLAAARYLLLGVVLPLTAVHLWIGVARDGLGQALKGIGRSLIRAFRPSSVLIYAIGALVFGVIPWLLVVSRTSSKSPWFEVALLGIRLVAAGTLLLFGWLVTIGALRLNSLGESAPDSSPVRTP